MDSPALHPLQIRAKSAAVIDHHFDDEKPGRPLSLLIPGALLGLAALGLIVWITWLGWYDGQMPKAQCWGWFTLLWPIYAGGVYLFSYGYELYDVKKALKLTAIIVFITAAAIILFAVLLAVLGGLAKGGGSSKSGSKSSSSSSPSSSGSSGGSGGTGGGFHYTHGSGGASTASAGTAAAQTPPPLPAARMAVCPFCTHLYAPALTGYACPSCHAPTPPNLLGPS